MRHRLVSTTWRTATEATEVEVTDCTVSGDCSSVDNRKVLAPAVEQHSWECACGAKGGPLSTEYASARDFELHQALATSSRWVLWFIGSLAFVAGVATYYTVAALA